MVLTFADSQGMKVYVGSLQTWSDWTDGTEFIALRKYNALVAAEILANYGSRHPSLGGWYFSQEIWMNWVQYYAPNYYGTTQLANYVTDMAALDPTRPVAAAVVFKETGYGAMPGMTQAQLQTQTTSFVQATGVQILAPQDGAGAEAGAPPVSDLPGYFQGLAAGVTAAGTRTSLWSTVETFTAVPNVPGEQYPPASAARIQQQVANERPWVTGYVNYIYGDDLSQQATYYPVEASGLNRDYRYTFRPGAVVPTPAIPLTSYVSSPGPSSSYPDTNHHLSDRTGGGYDNQGLTDWSGYAVEDTGGQVTITADLGSVQQISAVRALSLSMTDSGIYHPLRLAVETSTDGVNFTSAGLATLPSPDTVTFSVGWSELDVARAARYVRYNFTHQEWLFVSELEVLGNPNGRTVEIDPPSAFLYAGQSQQFTGSVLGGGGTVTWLSAGPGTVTQSGLYTAPASVAGLTEVPVMAGSGSAVTVATVTVAPDPTGVQMVGPVSPAGGSGRSQTFQFTAQPVSGSLEWTEIVFNTTLNPVAACEMYYDPGTGDIGLFSDDASVWYWATPGAAGATVSNHQCTVDAAHGSVQTTAGGGVRISMPVTFSNVWSGTLLYVWMAAADAEGNEVDWPVLGTWNVP